MLLSFYLLVVELKFLSYYARTRKRLLKGASVQSFEFSVLIVFPILLAFTIFQFSILS